MALVTTNAIVLKSMRWGEADRILTFFSLRLGKVRGIARGARRMKSRFGGMLEPFSSVNLTLFDKRNDGLASVSQVDSLESFISLRENLDHIWAASCMVALVDGVTADRDPSPTIFHTLLEGLRSLARTDDPGLLTLIFQIQVLGQSGFQPQIDQCASCGRDCCSAVLQVFSFGRGETVWSGVTRAVGTIVCRCLREARRFSAKPGASHSRLRRG